MGENYFFEIREIPVGRVLEIASRRAKEGQKRVTVLLPLYVHVEGLVPGKTLEIDSQWGRARLKLRGSPRGWLVEVQFLKRRADGHQLRLPFFPPEDQ